MNAAAEEEITAGAVFRRIPDWESYFDHVTGRPEMIAFQPRPKDNGKLSADTDKATAVAALERPELRHFGLCRLDVEAIHAETNGLARVVRTKLGASHVQIENCHLPEVQLALARIAVVERPPEP